MSVVWLDKDELYSVVMEKLENVEIVLDIGCGIMPQQYVRPLVHICCEPFEQYVKVLQEKTKDEYDRTYVIVNGGWTEAVQLFPPKSVDTVFLIDVIEHLEKKEALELLKATEPLIRSQLALFTPLGFMPQHHPDGKDAWGLDGAEWQEHKSGWQPEDFDDSWEIFAVRDFHSTDNMGRQLETHFGAMWAIKTLNKDININKSTTLNLISTIFTHSQNKNITLLSKLIQNIMLHTSDNDMKIFTAALHFYETIKYSKLFVLVSRIIKKFTTSNN